MMKSTLLHFLVAAVFLPFCTAAEKKVVLPDFPPEIRCIAVISPASFPKRKPIEELMNKLQERGIKVKPGKYIFCPEGSKATRADIEERRQDLMTAWLDPEVDLIICTRGGSGSEQLLPLLDWEAMRRRPEMKLIGFSNITCLTGAMLRQKAGHPFAGPNLGRIGTLTPQARESFQHGISGEAQRPVTLQAVRPGDCEGGIYAGHLSLLAKLDAMPEYRVDPAGRIVFIECVNRTAPQMEELWNQLLRSGFFKEVRGVVFGELSGLDAAAANDLRRKFADTLSCPVYCQYPYGHVSKIHTLDFFGKAVIRNHELRITPGTFPRKTGNE